MIILGDSIVKHLNGCEILWKLPSNCEVYVANFPDVKTKSMKDYLKPSLCENHNHFIVHVGTNDLKSKQSPERIVTLITDLVASLKMRTTMLVFQILLYALINRTEEKKHLLLIKNFQKFIEKGICI